MANGVDFTGNGGDDTSAKSPSGAAWASRGAKGPIDFAGDGGMDVGGTIFDTNPEGDMPPAGGDVLFTGNGGDDV
jgi:hypothetical protein